MYILLFWLLITGFRVYLNKFNYKYIDLYMSSFHSTIVPILYYYDRFDDLMYFSQLYFLFDIFIIDDLKYKLHHILTMFAIISVLVDDTNRMLIIGGNYLYYAEYPVILYNYIDYIERNYINYPSYYKPLIITHWILMIYTRAYKIGEIGLYCILNLERNLNYYVMLCVHIIIYAASIHWIFTRGKYVLYFKYKI